MNACENQESKNRLHELANRWDAPDARFALLDASVRAVLQQCARELRAALAEREESEAPPSAQCAITSALATLVRASHDVDELDDGVREIWRELAVEARLEYDGLRARVAELEQRAEKAEANYRFMVERAADEKLDGYRELGQRAASAEARAERAENAEAEWRAMFSHPALIERRLEEDRARIAELERDLTEAREVAVRNAHDASHLRHTAIDLEARLARVADLAEDLEQRAKRAEADKDAAYRERNQLVALLARIYPSGVRETAIEGWDPAWHGCVFVDTPEGQLSWHFHDSERPLFDLPAYEKPWDGHTTEQKYERIARLRSWWDTPTTHPPQSELVREMLEHAARGGGPRPVGETLRGWAHAVKELENQVDGYGSMCAEQEQRAERAEAEVAKLRFELERAVIDRDAAESRARQYLTDDKEVLARAEARVAELERELDAAQEHIHAGDECITSLHDDLARVADLVRCAEAWRDGDRKHPQRFDALVVPLLKAAEALPPRAGERCHCQWEAGDSPCPMHGDE
jgi:chromosome segregation ATPase